MGSILVLHIIYDYTKLKSSMIIRQLSFASKKNAPREGASYGEEQKRNLGAHSIGTQIGCQKS
jgi:hypothetical protein